MRGDERSRQIEEQSSLQKLSLVFALASSSFPTCLLSNNSLSNNPLSPGFSSHAETTRDPDPHRRPEARNQAQEAIPPESDARRPSECPQSIAGLLVVAALAQGCTEVDSDQDGTPSIQVISRNTTRLHKGNTSIQVPTATDVALRPRSDHPQDQERYPTRRRCYYF